MKKVLMIIFAVTLLTNLAYSERPKQVRLEKALESLEKAKNEKGKKKIGHLRMAKKWLKEVKGYKGGHKPKAVTAIEEAIDNARDGESADDAISKAIHHIKKGIQFGEEEEAAGY